MSGARALALERRRQVLQATVSLQRFALRGDIGSLRASIQPSAWQRPLALAALGVAARWGIGHLWTALVRR